jgi:LmbE family N-acetylglucosaminyl deacetylase
MLINFKNALVLAPHTDDGEYGCGGSISRFVREGKEIYYAAFSVCEQSVPYGLSEDVLEKELMNALDILGILPANRLIFRFPVRQFPQYRQDILEELIKIKSHLNPDLVFIPSPSDIHQDHQTLAFEGIRAFKNTTILGYEIPWNNLTFETSSFIKIYEQDLKKKVEALMCYKSQNFRHYANEPFFRSLAVSRGTQIGMPLAEVFQVVRFIIN